MLLPESQSIQPHSADTMDHGAGVQPQGTAVNDTLEQILANVSDTFLLRRALWIAKATRREEWRRQEGESSPS